jgi:hypothetical protein
MTSWHLDAPHSPNTPALKTQPRPCLFFHYHNPHRISVSFSLDFSLHSLFLVATCTLLPSAQLSDALPSPPSLAAPPLRRDILVPCMRTTQKWVMLLLLVLRLELTASQVLETEKHRNLNKKQHETSTPIKNAPGWNQYLASASEAAVKVCNPP